MHDYLGLIFGFFTKGKVMVNMIEYIKKLIANFPEELTMLKTSPAADLLFKVWEDSEAKPLLEEQAVTFHHTTMQLLFLSLPKRHDIQPATTFLTTQVKSPDEDDWGKVKQVLGHLKNVINMLLILSLDSLILS